MVLFASSTFHPKSHAGLVSGAHGADFAPPVGPKNIQVGRLIHTEIVLPVLFAETIKLN
jgi:hypothetical protein